MNGINVTSGGGLGQSGPTVNPSGTQTGYAPGSGAAIAAGAAGGASGGGNTPAPTGGGSDSSSWQPGQIPGQVSTDQSVLPSGLVDPFLGLAGVAGNLGTAAGQSLPGASQWLSQLYNPGLNPGELAFGQNLANLNYFMPGGLAQQQAQANAMYGQTPLASGALQAGNNLAFQNMLGINQQMQGLEQNRQGLASQQLANVFGIPYQMAQVGPNVANSLLGLIGQNTTGGMSGPMSFYQGLPYISPVVTTGSNVVSGGGKGKG